MTIKKLLLTISMSLMMLLSLSAQLSLDIADVTGTKGQIIEVEVRISGFTDITSMQFSVNWDSTVLAFQAVENITEALPAFTEREIGLIEAPSGAIRVAWFDNTIQGVSIPDSTQLFTLKFEVTGEAGTNSSITISDKPIIIEFTALDGSMVELSEIKEGGVTIPGNATSLTYLVAPNGMELHQNEPNPFTSITKISAKFPSVEPVQFFITDLTGKVVYSNTFKSVQGENTIEIGSHLLGIPGTYYYTLQSEHYQLSRKMILLP